MGGSASAMNLADIKLSEKECKHAVKELFQPKVFEAMADADNMVSLEALNGLLGEKTDVFLTHDWGHDLGMDNHERVSRVNDALKKRGLRTWFDGEKMEGNVKKKMIDGIEKTNCIAVFVTKRYMDKVGCDNAEDNCQLEFNYASRRKTGRKMVPVVMEARMQAANDWSGEVGMVLGGSLYVNLSTEDSFEARMDELYSRILGVTGTTIQKVLDSPVWGEIISQKSHSAPAAAPVAAPAPVEVAAGDSGPFVAELQAWIREHAKIVPNFANKYAKQLVENGVGSVDKLRKKLIRNINYLADIGFDEDDAEELMMAVLDRKEAPAPTGKPAEREYKDLYEALLSARSFGNAGKEMLEEAMNSADQERAMVAKMLLVWAYDSGGGTFTEDKTKSIAYAVEVLPWMHEHVLPPTDEDIAPSDVDPKPYALSTIVTTFLAWMIRNGVECEKDEAKSVLYMKAAVPHGNSMAQFFLAQANKMGKGTPVNEEQAVQYYRLAAAQGISLAIINLGYCYYNGEGVQKDLVEACRFFRILANKGGPRGLYELGTMYCNGEGVAKDWNEAARLFQLSYDKGNNDATYMLGCCYAGGKGVSKDTNKAKELFQKAIAGGSDAAKKELAKLSKVV